MVSIKKILCPIDFSEFSRHAFDLAVWIAKGYGASVTALHVVLSPPASLLSSVETTGLMPFVLPDVDRERLVSEVKRFLAIDGSVGVPIDCEVLDAPSVHHEILAQADRLPADLIVMGTHGRTGFQRLLFGSVTEKVLRTARPPVLTVGALPDVVPTGAIFTRILCAIDFSECSIAALGYAASLAERVDADLAVLHVVEWTPLGYDPLVGPPADLTGYWLAAEAVGRERLHNVIAGSPQKARKVEEIVTSGKPHHEILRIAAERGSDLIVLGIHGRNPIDRMLFGSTAEPVVRRAPCPVLTVRAKADTAPAA